MRDEREQSHNGLKKKEYSSSSSSRMYNDDKVDLLSCCFFFSFHFFPRDRVVCSHSLPLLTATAAAASCR